MFLVENDEIGSENEQWPQLRHLKNKPLIPGFLLLELSKSGIHLMPRNEDAA